MKNVAVQYHSTMFTKAPDAASRSCGSCGMCCKTHAVQFESGFKKPAGKWCEHWSREKHCGIYERRPNPCRFFRCEWLKGMGGDKHRPDRTKVVLDFVKLPEAPPGGILQMWEGAEGGLGTPYAREVARGALASNILTSHLYLNSRRRIFIPPGRELTQDFLEGVEREGFEIASLSEL